LADTQKYSSGLLDDGPHMNRSACAVVGSNRFPSSRFITVQASSLYSDGETPRDSGMISR
jgi:hypothetical protein